MSEKFFRREESSDLRFSIADYTCRTRLHHANSSDEYALRSDLQVRHQEAWCNLVLRAQCSENMLCLSSEREKRLVCQPVFMIHSI